MLRLLLFPALVMKVKAIWSVPLEVTHTGFHKVARNFSVWSRVAWLLIWIQRSPKEGQQNQVGEDKSLCAQIKTGLVNTSHK